MKPLVGIFIAAVATPALAQQDHGAAVQQAPATDAHHAHAGHEPGIPDPPGGPPSAAALGGPAHAADAIFGAATMAPARERSEEHTSELQSLMRISYAVFCLK